MPDKFPVIYSSFYKHNEFLTDDSPNRGNLLCLQSLQNCTNEISFQFARHDSILSNTGKFAIQIERINQKCSDEVTQKKKKSYDARIHVPKN